MTSDYETEKLAARARRTELRLARSAAEIDLDALDAQFRAFAEIVRREREWSERDGS